MLNLFASNRLLLSSPDASGRLNRISELVDITANDHVVPTGCNVWLTKSGCVTHLLFSPFFPNWHSPYFLKSVSAFERCRIYSSTDHVFVCLLIDARRCWPCNRLIDALWSRHPDIASPNKPNDPFHHPPSHTYSFGTIQLSSSSLFVYLRSHVSTDFVFSTLLHLFFPNFSLLQTLFGLTAITLWFFSNPKSKSVSESAYVHHQFTHQTKKKTSRGIEK